MTTIEAIKTLLAADYKLSYVLGYVAHMKEFDKDVFDNLVEARNKMAEVQFALCDELPDHIADPGKMVAKPGSIFIYDSNGDKAFCPRCRTLCCLECENPKKRGEKRLGYCAVCHEFFETDCAHIVEATK